MSEKFHYLKYGLAIILCFIGVKMLLPLFAEILIKLLGSESHSPLVEFLERFVSSDPQKNFQWEVIIVSLLIIVGVLIIFGRFVPDLSPERESGRR